MLKILRVQPSNAAASRKLSSLVVYRPFNEPSADYPDLEFDTRSYDKISSDKSDSRGEIILSPINQFLDLLTDHEQKILYLFYTQCKELIKTITTHNRYEVEEVLQEKFYDLIVNLNLPERLIAFSRSDAFVYPDLSEVGKANHHTKEKTFNVLEYQELNAISLLCKILFPVWGDLTVKLDEINIDNNFRKKISFELIVPNLEEGAFATVYRKLSYYISSAVADYRKSFDKNMIKSSMTTSFILTYNYIDDDMFVDMVMAMIVVNGLVIYESADIMIYINGRINYAAEQIVNNAQKKMTIMPRRALDSHDGDDNSSIIDHVSKTSNKPMDIPIFITTAFDHWELDRLVVDTDTPKQIFDRAHAFYVSSSFEISPLCQAMVATFIGKRLGGSKCLNYLSLAQYYRLVTMLQYYLIKNKMIDLATLVSAKSSPLPLDRAQSTLSTRLEANMALSSQYLECRDLFKGYLRKPLGTLGRTKRERRNAEMEQIDFTSHIVKIKDWLIKHVHYENMAPVLWEYSGRENPPLLGTDVQFDERVIGNLCQFYLNFYREERPF